MIFLSVVILLLFFCYVKYDFTLKSHNYKFDLDILDTEIVFKEGYFFKNSSIYKSNRLLASSINELCFPYCSNTYFIVNENEVIFVDNFYYKNKEQLIHFANSNNIPITYRYDTWKVYFRINEDKYFKWYLFRDCKINRSDINQMRRKVICIGVNDWDEGDEHKQMLINRIFLSKKFYWWSMEIALKGWKNSTEIEK